MFSRPWFVPFYLQLYFFFFFLTGVEVGWGKKRYGGYLPFFLFYFIRAMNVYVYYTTTTTSSITGRQRCWLHFQPPPPKKKDFLFYWIHREKEKKFPIRQLVDFESIKVITRKWLPNLPNQKYDLIWSTLATWTTSRQNNNSARAPGTFGWLGYIENGSRLLYSVVLPGYRSLRTLNVDIPDSVLLFCNPHNNGDGLVSWMAGKPQSRWMLSAVTSTLSAKHNGTNQPPTQIRPIDYFTILPSLWGRARRLNSPPLLVSTPAAHAS
jgi:hypothetical protein